MSLVLSLGLTPPYNRVVRGTLDFLHDTSEPFLRIFRRLGLRIGPLDLSPIVALIVLRLVGGLLVAVIDPGDADAPVARAAALAVGIVALDQADQGDRPRLDRPRRARTRSCRASTSSTRATRGVAFGLLRRTAARS